MRTANELQRNAFFDVSRNLFEGRRTRSRKVHAAVPDAAVDHRRERELRWANLPASLLNVCNVTSTKTTPLTGNKIRFEGPDGFTDLRELYVQLQGTSASDPQCLVKYDRSSSTVSVFDTVKQSMDALDRPTSVVYPDGNQTTTAFSIAESLAVTQTTDQQGKVRRTGIDALTRLRKVWEDPNGLGYTASYTYDSLDNLTTVNQSAQTRTFVYDSLKQLRKATNPEYGTPEARVGVSSTSTTQPGMLSRDWMPGISLQAWDTITSTV